MTALEAIQNVQFVTINEKRLAVLDAQAWEALVAWLEALEDLQVFKEASAALAAAEGDRTKAGWIRWEDVRDEVM
jgi:hypothetical protein